jgi:hypothetical protein
MEVVAFSFRFARDEKVEDPSKTAIASRIGCPLATKVDCPLRREETPRTFLLLATTDAFPVRIDVTLRIA